MANDNVVKLLQPGTFSDQLTEVLCSGARALLAQAVEAEVADFLRRHGDLETEDGHRRVVRHGHLPEREVMTGIGAVAVRQPRVRDREAACDDPGRIRQLQLIGGKLDDAAPRRGQGRVAPGRALSPRRLHRHQPVTPFRAGCCLLQQARDVRAMDQRRQERDQVDASVMLLVCRQRGASSVARAGLQLANFMRTLALPEAVAQWSLTSSREKLVKIGAKVVRHARYAIFQMAEVAVPKELFEKILRLIDGLRPRPAPA